MHSESRLVEKKSAFRLSDGYSLLVRSFSRPAETIPSSRQVELVVVHGGPALSTHRDYVDAFVPAAFDTLGVVGSIVFYDHLGCGESEKPLDYEYSLEAFGKHLEEVLRHLLRKNNSDAMRIVLGHSFGGQVAISWLLSRREKQLTDLNVVGVVISNAPLNERTYALKQVQLREDLDPDTRNYYLTTENLLAESHTCESIIYRKLIGLGESRITGSMRTFNVLDELLQDGLKLAVKCLFISGTFDNIPVGEYKLLSKNHDVFIIEEAGHQPFCDTKRVVSQYWSTIRQWITALEF